MSALALTVQDGAAQQEQLGKVNETGLTPSQFLNYCHDIQRQPVWRIQADKHVDYYDGNQLDAETMAELEAKGMGPLINNIIAPIVNVVLGMEAKTRSDWRVGADSDDYQDIAEAFSAKLMEVERETHANRATSDAYGGQIKAGLGWVEAWRNTNPFDYPYRALSVHRREIFWDWRDLSLDLSKARYLIRKRWYDVDQACAIMPQFKDLFEAAVGDQLRMYLQTMHSSLNLANSFDQMRGLDFEDIENWRSIERRRLCLYECWYRTFVRGYILRLPNQNVVELNMKNPVHVALLSRGLAKPEPALYTKMRMSIWCGPVKLMDIASNKDYTPYIPFWGYREDRTGVPYGLIRAMISPQDEVNARRQKLLWLLGAKRVTMDNDALHLESNTVDTMLQEIARPDAVVVLNAARMNKVGSFNVDHNLGMAQEQFEVMKDSEEAAQRVVGVFNALLGRESSTTANSAITSLVEQGTTALAEINDNYRFARRTVGERLLDMARDDMMGQQVTIVVGEAGKRKSISLNQPAVHQPSGMQIVLNDVRSARVKVALEDVPSTPAYRQQQFTMLSEVMKGLPPQLQAAIAPFYFEASDLQKRREMADIARKVLGQAEPQTPEEAQAQQQAQAQAAQNQQRAIMLDLAEREAKIGLLQAQAEKFRADANAEGMTDADRAAFEQEIANLIAGHQQRIDSLTSQIVTERAGARLREQALKTKLSQTQAAQHQPGEDHGAAIADLKKQMDASTQTFADELAKMKAQHAARQAAKPAAGK